MLKILSYSSAVCFFISGCTTAPIANEKANEKKVAFYTDVKGPSKESGDCGGYAFLFNLSGNKLISGEATEFEGGCKMYPKQILELHHDPITQELKFAAPSSDPNQLVSFIGRVSKSEILGVVTHIDKVSRKSVNPKAPKTQRTFLLINLDDFQRKLSPTRHWSR